MLSGILAFLLIPIWVSNYSGSSLYSYSDWVYHIALLLALFSVSVLLPLFTLHHPTGHTIPLGGLSVITLATAWAVRWVTLMEVQTIARFDVGPYPYDLPMGSNGLLGIVGMFGLWIALALLSSELIQPKCESTSSTSTQC